MDPHAPPWAGIVSLIVSLVTLYLTQFSGSKLSFNIGPQILFYNPKNENQTSFFLPIAFINSGSKSGVIIKCAAIVSSASAPDQNYYVEWRQFHKYVDSMKRWDFEDLAAAFPVGPKSSERRYIQFQWDGTGVAKLHLVEGIYYLRTVIWTSVNPKPILTKAQSFRVSAADAQSWRLIGLIWRRRTYNLNWTVTTSLSPS